MMKLLLALIVFSLISGMLAQSILLLHYELDKDYYSQVLCINKDQPSLNCEGKCQLKKELERQEKNEQNPAVPLKIKSDVNPLYFTSHSGILSIEERYIEMQSSCAVPSSAEVVNNIFRPPMFGKTKSFRCFEA
jgi:hypothetical protein